MESLVATTRGLRERREVAVMDEKQRILKTLTDLYDGHPWTDLSIAGVIRSLTAEQASAKPTEHLHSIWAQLNHIILWRTKISRLMSRESANRQPDSEDFDLIADTSETAWRDAKVKLEESQRTLLKVVTEVADDKLDIVANSFNVTYSELIQGIIHHDAYHLGQAMIAKKLVAQRTELSPNVLRNRSRFLRERTDPFWLRNLKRSRNVINELFRT